MSLKNYDGPVQGCLYGSTKGKTDVCGKLVAHMRYLTLNGSRFRARVIGRIKTRRGNVALRGELSGEVDVKTGQYDAAFTGVVSARKKEACRTKFKAHGAMGASASFSFAVINGGDQQGIDLSARIVGDASKVCRKLRTGGRKAR